MKVNESVPTFMMEIVAFTPSPILQRPGKTPVLLLPPTPWQVIRALIVNPLQCILFINLYSG